MSIFLFIFFDFRNEFYSKQIFRTIITTVPAILNSQSSAYFLRCRNLLISIFFIYFFRLPWGVLFGGNFLDDHNYRTPHSIQLIRCSFPSLSNSLDEDFFKKFFDFLKGFYWEENLWTIITTVPVIVYTWFGAHFLQCDFLLMNLLFTSLRGFTGRNSLDNNNYRTRHSIRSIGCSFSSLTYSPEAQFFCIFFLFSQRVLLNEHFFENHNYRMTQNICQRRNRALD